MKPKKAKTVSTKHNDKSHPVKGPKKTLTKGAKYAKGC